VLTRRGISTIVVAVGLTAVGWLLVIRELMIIGITVGLVGLVALASVWLPVGNSMQFTRSFLTRGVHSGDTLRVDLEAQGRWTPTLSIQERLPTGRSITASLAGKGRTLSFETPPLHRGLNLIGPTVARRTDFFGLVQRTSNKANPSPLIVWPARTSLSSSAVRKLLIDPTSEPRIGAMKPGRPVAAFEGDLRAYVPGDEPRRIHWPSSARTGNLVVRTDASIVSDNRSVLTIDLDTAHHSAESFELLLSVATSLVIALLPVSLGSLHREDQFDDDVIVEVLESEQSPTPGRNRFRYPELLLDRLALATFQAGRESANGSSAATKSSPSSSRSSRSSSSSSQSSPPSPSSSPSPASSRSTSVKGGLLLGGPWTNFTGSSLGIQCTDARTVVASSGSVVQVNQLDELASLVLQAPRSPRSKVSRAAAASRPAGPGASTATTKPAPANTAAGVGRNP
jgi:Protein of unknown function DUF58